MPGRAPAEIEVVYAITVGRHVVIAHAVVSLGKPPAPAGHAIERVYPKLDPRNDRQRHIIEQVFAGIVVLGLDVGQPQAGGEQCQFVAALGLPARQVGVWNIQDFRRAGPDIDFRGNEIVPLAGEPCAFDGKAVVRHQDALEVQPGPDLNRGDGFRLQIGIRHEAVVRGKSNGPERRAAVGLEHRHLYRVAIRAEHRATVRADFRPGQRHKLNRKPARKMQAGRVEFRHIGSPERLGPASEQHEVLNRLIAQRHFWRHFVFVL